MDKKRWILTAIVVFVVVSALEWFFHSVCLGGIYSLTSYLWRPEAEMTKLLPYGLVANLIVSFILVYIYHKGYEGKGSRLAEGLRFGLIIGLFTAIPMSVWSYVVFPMAFVFPAAWFAIGMIEMLVAGAIIGLLYKRATI